MPKSLRDIVNTQSRERGELVQWSENYQGAYVIPLKFESSGSHVTVFVDSLSDTQKTYLKNQPQQRAHLDDLETRGKTLEFSEFHITRNEIHFYYRIDGRRIYKTSKFSSERTATERENWTDADKEASVFLQNINLDPQKGQVYDPQGTLVFQPQ